MTLSSKHQKHGSSKYGPKGFGKEILIAGVKANGSYTKMPPQFFQSAPLQKNSWDFAKKGGNGLDIIVIKTSSVFDEIVTYFSQFFIKKRFTTSTALMKCFLKKLA